MQETDVGSILGRAVAAGLGPGWVAGAFREGEEGLCWCAGKRALGGEEVTADLWFDLASLTKPLVTTTLLLLARREGLDLRTCLEDLLPELAGSPWAGVTVEQCATHSAGFPAWEPLYLGGLGHEHYLARLAAVPPAGRSRTAGRLLVPRVPRCGPGTRARRRSRPGGAL